MYHMFLFTEYRLMVMCSSESQETSHVVSKLLRYKRDYTVRRNDADLSEYLKHHLMVRPGSTVDPDKYVSFKSSRLIYNNYICIINMYRYIPFIYG